MIRPSIVVQSDCGLASTEFCKIAGSIESAVPDTDVVDCNIALEKGNVPQASAFLYTVLPFWPDGTIFLSLVGEGRPVAVRTSSGSVIVTPDNGTATMCIRSFGFGGARLLSAQEGADARLQLAAFAAKLSAGDDFARLGSELKESDLTLLPTPASRIGKGRAEGEVSMVLRTFGNLTFSIGTDEFEDTGIRHGDPVRVTFTRGSRIEWQGDMTFQPSFGYVPEGAPVLFNGSSGYIDIGLNRRSFVQECLPQVAAAGTDPGDFKVIVEKTGEQKK
ncbi:MAG: SAM-dependent chlorinase/fluorinase [Oscillospiraceae bacterium]|nr:SAM-dependent chlorinase/fluorinase [Oscillospiraceae bacterium]